MKKVAFFFLLALSLWACQNQGSGGGEISGTVSLGRSITSSLQEGFGFAGTSLTSGQPTQPRREVHWVPGEVLVKALPGKALPSRMEVGGKVLGFVRPLALPGWGLYRVEGIAPLGLEALDLEALSQTLEGVPGVEKAHPNYVLDVLKTPNDPFYPYQWHYPAMNLPQAWDIEDGRSRQVVVAVIDSGIKKQHPDLAPVLLSGYDFVSDPQRSGDGDGRDPDPEEPLGTRSGYHGSHVSGTIAASTNDGVGVAGVSWGAKILPVRALGAGGGSLADIYEGLLWAVGLDVPGVPRNPNPAQVVNMSLGGPVPCPDLVQEVIDRANQQPQKPIIVVAAGNDQQDARNFSPASCAGVITVGATEYRGYRAYYSNYGPRIDVMAPGGDTTLDQNGDQLPDGVLSTVWDEYSDQPSLDFMQGTSMASPHVAGLVALMKARNPNLGLGEVLSILKQTARPLNDQACTGLPHDRVEVYLSGSDCGAGLVDAYRALQMVAGGGGGPGPGPDFQIQLSPASLTLAPGQSGQVTVNILGSGGFNGSVNLSLEGNPPGVSGAFVPNPTSSSSTLTLTVAATVSPGTYSLRVRGVSGSLVKEATLGLTVSTAPPPSRPTVRGAYVFALYLTPDEEDIDPDRSKYVRIDRDGNSAPYSIPNLEGGKYVVVGWKDANGNQDVDEGDYLGVYMDNRGDYRVIPPKGGVDFALELMVSSFGTSSDRARVRDWVQKVWRRP